MTNLAGGSRPLTYERDGPTLVYSVMGDGQPILFVHGATATGEFEWGRLAARLASDYQCVLPDLRGHGRSEFRESTEMGRFAEVNASARYVELDGAAPAVHHKCLDRFTRVISAFLAEVDSERAGSHGAAEDS
jgi:pimeloyl-ACP methyl ester carboxylesterase